MRDEGTAGATDRQVLAAAAAGGLILITADRRDFGRELALTRAITPSVILLRQLPDVVRAADVAALLLANFTGVVTSALEAGSFIVERHSPTTAPISSRAAIADRRFHRRGVDRVGRLRECGTEEAERAGDTGDRGRADGAS